MGKKAYSSVLRNFPGEVEVAFNFLADDLGLTGPRLEENVVPSVCYEGSSYGYDIILDTQEVTVHTSVWIMRGGRRLFVDLEKLAESLEAANSRLVKKSAQTLAALKKSLASQASLVRTIHAQVAGPDGQDLIAEAVRSQGAGWG